MIYCAVKNSSIWLGSRRWLCREDKRNYGRAEERDLFPGLLGHLHTQGTHTNKQIHIHKIKIDTLYIWDLLLSCYVLLHRDLLLDGVFVCISVYGIKTTTFSLPGSWT